MLILIVWILTFVRRHFRCLVFFKNVFAFWFLNILNSICTCTCLYGLTIAFLGCSTTWNQCNSQQVFDGQGFALCHGVNTQRFVFSCSYLNSEFVANCGKPTAARRPTAARQQRPRPTAARRTTASEANCGKPIAARRPTAVCQQRPTLLNLKRCSDES